MEYRNLEKEEITNALFEYFDRHQVVTKCWRKIDGKWCIKDIAFVEEWEKEEYDILVECLRNTVSTNGLVTGAFDGEELKGFVSVESKPFGSKKQYLELSFLYVSADKRGQGIGKALFELAKHWAKEHGAKKLYISGHSAIESQAFYQAMGCVEAEEYDQAHVEKEPCDCQIECEVMPSVELKELSMKDIEMIKAFFVSVFTKEPWNDDWSDEEQLHAYIVDLIGNRNSLTFGLFENDMMVGLAMGEIKHWYEGTEYFIHELCIKTDEQGRGLGSKFIVQIKKFAKNNRIKHLFLLTERNVPAYDFYKKNGFLELENNVALFIET